MLDGIIYPLREFVWQHGYSSNVDVSQQHFLEARQHLYLTRRAWHRGDLNYRDRNEIDNLHLRVRFVDEEYRIIAHIDPRNPDKHPFQHLKDLPNAIHNWAVSRRRPIPAPV